MNVYSYVQTLLAGMLLVACTTVSVEKPPPAMAPPPEPAPPPAVVLEPAPPPVVAPAPPPVGIPEPPPALRALRFFAHLKERPPREQRRRGEQAAALQTKLERIKALEKEMQERSTARELRSR